MNDSASENRASAEERGSWGSSVGFILAAAGSAVGLGNIWGFPMQADKGRRRRLRPAHAGLQLPQRAWAFLVLPNLIAPAFLSGTVARLARDYFSGRKEYLVKVR